MATIIPGKFGATLAERRVLWAPLYHDTLQILGSTGLIIPIGDTNHEAVGLTTVTTLGDEAAVFTWSEARSAFDSLLTFIGPARIPIQAFNGTDEEADTPDAAFWSRNDAAGSNQGFSIGVWANVTNTAASRTLLGRWNRNVAGELREWVLAVDSGDPLSLYLYDESANVQAARTTDAAITMGSLTHFVVTYDGTGGATAANGITIYQNGAAFASTAANNASYDAMENLATTTNIGFQISTDGSTPDGFFSGSMAGGPLGPFWTTAVLTADEVKRLYTLGRSALGV